MSEHNTQPPRRGLEPALVRLYALLLWLYPAAFRREYGEEMLRVLRERVRDTERSQVPGEMLWLWGWVLGDLVVSAVAERTRGRVEMTQDAWGRVAALAAAVGGILGVVFGLFEAVVEYAGWHDPTLLLLAENACPPGFPDCAGQPSGGTGLLVQLITVTQASWFGTVDFWVPVVLVPLLTLVVALVFWTRLRTGAPRLALWGGVLALVGMLAEMVYVLVFVWQKTPQTPRVLAVFGLGTPIFALGLVLLGVAAWRVRPLPVGNRLLAPLGVLLVVPFVLIDVPFTLVPILGTAGIAAYQQNLTNALGLWILVIPPVAQAVGSALLVVIGVGLWRGTARPAGVRTDVARAA